MSEQEKEAVEQEKKVGLLENIKFMNADEYSEEELEALTKLYDESFKDIHHLGTYPFFHYFSNKSHRP